MIGEWLGSRIFGMVHQHNLVYNTCWEDPRLDREALELGPSDDVLVITSAGCNALDYVLAGARHVHAVDLNPRQNALLELKLAGARRLDYDTYFAFFGEGRVERAGAIYARQLREDLSPWSRRYWDRWIGFFDAASRRGSFFFRGTCGAVARGMNAYLDRVGLRPWVHRILDAASVREQRRIYTHLRNRLWTPLLRFAVRRDTFLSLLGVPRPQRRQVEMDYRGGIARFVEDNIEAVFARLPLAENYFWRVYLTGRYTRECCPEYLKPEGFARLRQGLADRVSVHTTSVQGFLERHPGRISRFVLLDHMDWLADRHFPLLESEWQAIVDRARPGARILWRSGGVRTDFVDRAHVTVDGRSRPVGELLRYHREMAQDLHRRCRVHTYGSFHIADLTGPTSPPSGRPAETRLDRSPTDRPEALAVQGATAL